MAKQTVGILHPGAMGISVAVSMIDSGYDVLWASAGRSYESKQRANEHNLTDVGTLADLCQKCQIIVSVCPPHAAEQVAEDVIRNGFSGLYLDANAISPQKASHIAEKMDAANIKFVDGGIIGGPAWQPKRTYLYLSGEHAQEAEALFANGALETEIISDEIGKASALKMCYAANTKGSAALLSLVVAAAHKLGVNQALDKQWARQDDSLPQQNHSRVQRVTQKAWRFAGEMDEMVETFGSIGLPDGFHASAADLYRRMAGFKGMDELPELLDVVSALLNEVDE